MSLEELNLDGGEIASNASEAPSEKSEKQKESSRRAQAQLQKTQKDEKKAKQDNDDLFLLLARFIQNPLYESLIGDVVLLLQNAYPSRFILVLIALVYPEAAHYLFDKINKHVDTKVYTDLYHYTNLEPFHNDTLHPSLREWVTLWMSSSQEFLRQKESSVVLQQKTITLFSAPTKIVARESITKFFIFFLASKNISIQPNTASTYGDFILTEYEKVILSFLKDADVDLRDDIKLDARDLFGMRS